MGTGIADWDLSVRSGRLKGQVARRWLRGNENRLEIARLNSEMIESRPCFNTKGQNFRG